MNIKKHIPNLITLINLFCGCIAVVFISKANYEMAFYMVCLGIFFDFFDGFFARLFKVSSPLRGKDLIKTILYVTVFSNKYLNLEQIV